MKREKVYCEAVKADVYKDTKGCLGYSCDTCPELKSIHSKGKVTQEKTSSKDCKKGMGKIPTEFAKLYSEGKIILPVFFSISNVEKTVEKLSKTHPAFPFKEHKEYVDNNFLEYMKNGLKNEIKDNISEIKRNKLNTLSKLKIESAVEDKIYIALWEFYQAMLLPFNLKMINTEVVKIREKTIEHCERTLRYPFLIKSFRESAQKELEELRKYDRNKATYHYIKELDYITTLYDSSILDLKETNEKLLEMLQTPLKVKEGRPYKFFYKVLQIVVFNYLCNADTPKEKAKHLTADIINEYKGKNGSLIVKMIVDEMTQEPSFAKKITKIIKQRLSDINSLDYKDIDNAIMTRT